MFTSRSDLRDPCPEASTCDLTDLDWEASWACALTSTIDDGYGAPVGYYPFGDELDAELDAELRALLAEEDVPDPGMDALLAELTDAALAAEARAEANTGNPLTDWSDEAIVAEAARLERLTRWSAARGYELINELARRRPDPSGAPDEDGLSAYAVDEIAVSTGVSRWTACRRVAEADALTHRHPQLLLALSAGCLTVPAVLKVLDTTALLDPSLCAPLERRLLDRAGRPVLDDLGTADPTTLSALTTQEVIAVSSKATPAYLGRLSRDLAQRLDPAATKKREAKAKNDRSVHLEPPVDGMAWLTAHLPAAAALAAYEHLNTLAHDLPAHLDGDPDGVTDPRSMDAKRADVLVDLLLGTAIKTDGTIAPPAPVHVHVIIDGRRGPGGSGGPGSSGPGGPDDTDGLPGEIAGLGLVTADTLRDLLNLAEHTAGTVDGAIAVEQPCPGTDTHNAEGPGPDAPPERLKNLLRIRHRVCVFPGCARPSRKCELDHTLRYPEGPTCICNLAPLCVHHHHLKHQAPGWHLTNHGDGRLTWTTPTGRRIQVGDINSHEGPEPPGPPKPDPPPRPEDTPPF